MTDTKQIVITVDKDIPHPGSNAGKRVTTLHTLYHDKLKALAVGDSFFVEGKTRADLQPVLRYAKRIGVKLSALDTDEDEVYMVPGVRVWRVSEHTIDPDKEKQATEVLEDAGIVSKSDSILVFLEQLSVQSGVSYWRKISTGEVHKLGDGECEAVTKKSDWELVNEQAWIEHQSSDL